MGAIVLLLICLFISACTSGRDIYTSASYNALPTTSSRISVQGNNGVVLTMAKAWLRDRGLYVIEDELSYSVAISKNDGLCARPCPMTAPAERAKPVDADYVVRFHVSAEHNPERLSIVVTSAAMRTGNEIFSAEALVSMGTDLTNEEERNSALKSLLCHALATIWQYRPGGYANDWSFNYCYLPRVHP